MLPHFILFDMTLLALETVFSPGGLLALAGMIVLLLVVRRAWGHHWVVPTAFGLSLVSVSFILFQVGQSAWGSGLMLYLLPSQIVIWGGCGIALLLSRLGLFGAGA